MSYLEQKRNALLNSVASSSGGGIEYIDTITVTETTEKINIEVDTSQYGTFFIVGDFNYNQANNNWVYLGVNNTAGTYYNNRALTQTFTIPSSYWEMPIVFFKGTSDKAICGTNAYGTNLNTLWENVTHLTLGVWASSSSRYDVGTKLYVYGMRESLGDIGA